MPLCNAGNSCRLLLAPAILCYNPTDTCPSPYTHTPRHHHPECSAAHLSVNSVELCWCASGSAAPVMLKGEASKLARRLPSSLLVRLLLASGSERGVPTWGGGGRAMGIAD